MRRAKVIFIGLFSLILIIPGTLMILGVVPENIENRTLAEVPEWRPDSLETFTNGFTKYVADHLPLRDYSYRTTALFNWNLLNTSSKPELTIKGKRGWMFYSNEGALEDATHRRAFSQVELDSIEKLVLNRATVFRKRGLEYTIVVVPNKSTALRKYLPDHYQMQQGDSRLEQVRKLFTDNPYVRFIDLHEVMQDSVPLYYKTDTHWNPQGARKAAKVMARRMVKSYQPVQYSTKKEVYSGDLAKMLGLSDVLTEEISVPFDHLKIQELEVAPYINVDQHVYYQPVENFSKVLVFHDSYGKGLFPYLPSYFQRTTFIWDSHINMDIVEKEKPNFVVHLMAERYVDRLLWP